MCGIAGFNWDDKQAVRKMMDLMAHRGPDGEGMSLDGSVSLGHKRLAIIDLSDSAAQPMSNEDGSVLLVANGEIYNYVELAAELASLGHVFRSRTDSEVIIHAYEEWGADCLNRFNGMFAFCVYDRKKRLLFLARDRFGIKPLYYCSAGGRFAFSSEIKPLLSLGLHPKEADEKAVFEYLLFNCYDHLPGTFFKGVKRVPPGNCLIYDLKTSSASMDEWYDIPVRSPERPCGDEAGERFLELFSDSIRLRMRSDVEVGSCLSGGLDSSSIVCLLERDILSGPRDASFKTFSMVFPGRDIDESVFIEEVGRRASGLEMYSTSPTELDLAADLKDLVRSQEEPFGGTSIFAQWEVMELAAGKNMKVLLDGQGGDELLAGYPFMHGYYLAELLKKGRVLKLAAEMRSYGGYQPTKEGLLSFFFLMAPLGAKPFLYDLYFHQSLSRGMVRKYLRGSEVPALLYGPADLNTGLYRRMKYMLPSLLREEDRNSMAFSIETRLPFLDYRLVEFLFSLPSECKIERGVTKRVLRDAMRGVIPEEVRTRKVKQGFTTPVDEWMRSRETAGMLEEALGSDITARYFDAAGIKKVYRRHLAREINAGLSLWKMLNLNLWHDMFITGDAAGEAGRRRP